MPSFKSLDHQTQHDLLEWFNVREPSSLDKMKLAELAEQGLFEAWDCPKCGDRVYRGQPRNWNNYQGVLQVDYTSYPGAPERHTLEYLESMCDHCRMYDT